ncbi:hypothetical protein M885DRAFT_506259 [Pelagophyceae sp. CCMP2097]|nr:hypothetical protein M885DRAFT_506259 [Pelagophyceae sp. CCMP2097]
MLATATSPQKAEAPRGRGAAGHSSPPPMLVKRASFLESEAAAASHPNRTYFMPVASHAATISRCTRELRDAKGDAARCRELRRERAAARVRAADVDGALHDYSKALASIEAEAHFEASEAAVLRYSRGEVLVKLGREREAIADFTACLVLAPKHTSAAYARASCYNRVGEFHRAIDDYHTALDLDDGLARPHGLSRPSEESPAPVRESIRLGADVYATERERELRCEFERSELERSRSSDSLPPPPRAAGCPRPTAASAASAAHARGLALRRLRDFAGAVAAYDECLGLDARHFRALFDRAFAFDALGDVRAALADYSSAIAVDPMHALALYNRGIAHERLAMVDAAVRDFSGAIDLAAHAGAQDLPVADFYHNRAFCRRKLSDFAGAVADYGCALERDREHFKALYNRAFCLDALLRRPEALADYEAAVQLRPRHASAHHNRGVVLEKLGRLDDALLAFDEAIVLAGDATAQSPKGGRRGGGDGDGDHCLGAALYARALVLERLRRFDAAGDALERAANVRPRNAEYCHAHGANLRHRGLHERAVAAFTDALDVAPQHRAARANRAYSLRKLRRFPDAVRDYTAAIEAAAHELRRLEARTNRAPLEAALAKLRNARAYCHARSDDFAAAVADYSAAISLVPGDAHAHHNRAISHDRLGDFEAAAADFARVVELEQRAPLPPATGVLASPGL